MTRIPPNALIHLQISGEPDGATQVPPNMADAKPNPEPAAAAAAAAAAKEAPKPPRPQNPVFKMMGLPNLPRKLPSRNWLIFWGITTTLASAIIYDKREKKRATAKWRRVVAPLSKEIITSPNQLPRKLTIYIEAPPGDTLRAAQEHYIEYVKPVLSQSGLDWEFVQGRQQGDVRAAVAEKIRRTRRSQERPGEEQPSTDESNLLELRKKMGLPEYEGMKGDIVIGRHAWKEYMRGLHEGWLGPLDAPPLPEVEAKPIPEGTEEKKDEEKKEEPKEKKPTRPPQPVPHNTPEDYASAALPATIPNEFSPSTIIPFPHRLGFKHTFVRLGWFLNRRKLADNIGRDVAAACFATSRDWRSTDEGEFEQQLVQKHEEKDWPKSFWAEEPPKHDDEDENSAPKERIWVSPMVVDPRVVQRMRRFEITPEDEARAAEIKVPETEVEGWIKGSLRSLGQGVVSLVAGQPPKGPNVGNIDDE